MKIKIYTLSLVLLSLSACTPYNRPEVNSNRKLQIFPDYADVTFPPNIAAPNFIIKEKGKTYRTMVGYDDDKIAFTINRHNPHVTLQPKKWKQLTEEAPGKEVFFRVRVLQDGKWVRYDDTFSNNMPATMLLHIRGENDGTLIYKNNQVEKITLKTDGYKNRGTYPSWHPSERYIAFAMNDVGQFFHSVGQKPVEVSDLESDLAVYDTETNKIFTDSLLFSPNYMETFPTWSRDGKTLFSPGRRPTGKACRSTASVTFFALSNLMKKKKNFAISRSSSTATPSANRSHSRECHPMAAT